MWLISPIKTPKLQWGSIRSNTPHHYKHCQIELLTGEKAGFCCGRNGKYANVPTPLPPMPEQYDAFLNHPHISSLS
jgi:hypothetical protein